jgi:hypothetical protein
LKIPKKVELADAQKARLQKQGAALPPPKYAIANGNFCGVMPAHLSGLNPTKAELAMVSLVFKTGLLVIVRAEKQKGGPGQYKMESHTSSYDLDVTQVVKSLPICPEDVPFKVMITGPRAANLRMQIGDRFNVRRGVVRKLLQHLKSCNPYYKNVIIDDDMLERLPENAMLNEFVVEQEVEDEPSADAKEVGGLKSRISCLVSRVPCLMSRVPSLMSRVSCLVSNVSCLHVSCPVSRVSTSRVSCLYAGIYGEVFV